MNTKALNSLADLICRVQEQDRTPMGIAFAVDAAGRHMSPEKAAELEHLRRSVESNRVDGRRLIRAEQRTAELEAVLGTHRKDDQAEIERLRARVAELEALTPAAIQTCRVCGAGYTYGQSCSTCTFRARMAAETDGITQRIAPTQALQLGPLAEWVAETFSPRQAAEGEFHAYLHRAFTTPHDLPETGGAL